MAEARQVLRQILRTVDRHVTSVNGNTTWRQHILQEFRQSAGVEDPAQRDQLLQQAKDYAFLVHSVQEYKDLLMSYNIGVDRDKERRDLMSSTAARVGFSLPDFPDETLAQEQENKS
eukprot:jgi/Astpho2/6876/e_gw1.00106.59.1_t